MYFFDTILLKGGTLAVGDAEIRMVPSDLLIEGGRIAAIAPSIPADSIVSSGAAPVIIEASGLLISYGFADIHVHLREPGAPSKETIATGSRAAARGGYTTVCAMPNLDPVPDSPENIALEQQIIEHDAVVEVLPYAAITLGRKGLEVVDMEALKGRCIAFSDDGSGVQRKEVMLEAMRLAASLDCIIAAHCEDESLLHGGYIHAGEWCAAHGHKGISSESEWVQIERDLELAAATGCRYHVCHISTRRSVELIRQAKRSGVRVSCETAPHYLVLCDAMMQEDGRFKMNPPLRSADDREALREGIADGTIDAIATDHAPHTEAQKSLGLEGSAMGVVGLETAYAVLNTHLVKTGLLSVERLLELLSASPRKIFSLGGALRTGERADITLIDPEKPWRIEPAAFLSKGRSTPFAGMDVCGDILLTLKDGCPVWDPRNIFKNQNSANGN